MEEEEEIILQQGDIVQVVDDVDDTVVVIAVIAMVEYDQSDEFHWYYLKALDEDLNIYPDPVVGMFWKIYPSWRDNIISVIGHED